MKLLAIGDSHTSKLIAASLEDTSSVQLVPFAKPGISLDELSVSNGRIHAVSSDFRNRLEQLGSQTPQALKDFDVIVVVAMSISVFSVARMSSDKLVTGWPSGNEAVQELVSGNGENLPALLSEQALHEGLVDLARNSFSFQLASAIRREGNVPIAFVPQPFPSEQVLDKSSKLIEIKRIVKRGDGPGLARSLNAALLNAFEAIPNSRLYIQPDGTSVQGCLTGLEFMRGAKRLSQNSKQPKSDVLHGNASLGRKYLHLMQDLSCASPQT
ncbi:hypothetical protein NBRC116590_16810 [Pelagimonas sp. KU-00592-HH]|uniref:hypothetical protein n=1 Tax=Pelagimonas sp. KU-00592-HH TaxID=3127651 RepID=UPI0031075CF3